MRNGEWGIRNWEWGMRNELELIMLVVVIGRY